MGPGNRRAGWRKRGHPARFSLVASSHNDVHVRSASKTRVSEDALFGGRIALFQPAPGFGYRANVDALLLAAFAGQHRTGVRSAVDLGAGVGAVGLSLFHLGAAERVAFVERDASLAALCRRNLEANGFEQRSSVLVGDLERPLRTISGDLVHAASLVVANPPYVAEARDGRPAPNPGSHARQRARHGDLAPFLRSAAEALGRRGRACFVYPAHALLDLMTLGRKVGLEPKRLRFVHGKADRPARIALIELAFAKAGGLVVDTPLIETGSDGRPNDEVARLVRP
jgi:tRNA1Val (adenine37-N6)-methyltransferase